MIRYVSAMGKQHLGPHVVVRYGIKIFWPGLFITSPDHLVHMASHKFEKTARIHTIFASGNIERLGESKLTVSLVASH